MKILVAILKKIKSFLLKINFIQYYVFVRNLLKNPHYLEVKKLTLKEELKTPTRTSIINFLLSLKAKETLYLEIGVRNPSDNFNHIKSNQKYSVDPGKEFLENPVDFKMTSDDFFKANKKQFDVIFIDGLHHYEQVQKDLINSLNVLNQDGLILIHDMLPQNPGQEKVPQSQASWTGDVWKLAVELLESKIDFVIANIDHGVGIVKPRGKKIYKSKNEKLFDQRFDSFMEIKEKLPIVTCEEAFDFIDS